MHRGVGGNIPAYPFRVIEARHAEPASQGGAAMSPVVEVDTSGSMPSPVRLTRVPVVGDLGGRSRTPPNAPVTRPAFEAQAPGQPTQRLRSITAHLFRLPPCLFPRPVVCQKGRLTNDLFTTTNKMC